MNKRIWIIVFLVLIAAAAAGYFLFKPSGETDYSLYTVKEGSVNPVIITSSNITSDDIFMLSFSIQGKVSTVTVVPGDEVTEGEHLARISSDQIESSYETSRLNLQAAELRYKQTEQLDTAEIEQLELQVESARKNLDIASEALSDASNELDTAEQALETTTSPEVEAQYQAAREKYRAALSQYYSAESAYEQALLSLENSKQRKSLDLSLQNNQISLARVNLDATSRSVEELEMLSPVDGLVLKVNIKPGDMVPNQQLAQTSSADIVIARRDWNPAAIFYLDQADLIRVKEGMPVIATLDVLPDTTMAGTLVEVDRYPESGPGEAITYRAKAVFDSRPSAVLPGMSITLSILLPEERGLIIPVTSVRYLDGVPHVFISKNGRLEKVRVSTGASDNEHVIVTSGLKKGVVIAANIGELPEETLQER